MVRFLFIYLLINFVWLFVRGLKKKYGGGNEMDAG